MRLLVITRAPWKNDNGIGRTFTDFFSDFSEAEIYSLCMREAPSVSKIPQKNFYVSEQQFLKKLLGRGEVGKISGSLVDTKDLIGEDKLYSRAKRINSMLLSFAREFLWDLGLWKNKRLDDYLIEVDPDVVFFPDFPCIYAHKVLKYIQYKTGAKVVIFHADDCYTLKHFSLSPFFWAYRFYLRKWVKKSVSISSLHYVISDVQKVDYDHCFNVDNKILTKFASFDDNPSFKEEYNKPLQLVFTGNIGINRWKTLAIIAKALKRLNENGIKAQLRIYTANDITNKINKALNINNTSFIMGKRSSEEIVKIQSEADILVHVEAMDLKHRLIVRQSFSTKIVDYLKSGRAILAVGPKEVASIKHLKDNNCAMIASDEDEIIKILEKVIKSNDILTLVANKGFDCGKNNHNKKEMIKMLHDEISGVCK